MKKSVVLVIGILMLLTHVSFSSSLQTTFNKGIACFCQGNLHTAYAYFDKVCDEGDRLGCLYAGMVQEMEGRSGLFEAEHYYRKACKEGLSIACTYLKGALFKQKHFLRRDSYAFQGIQSQRNK